MQQQVIWRNCTLPFDAVAAGDLDPGALRVLWALNYFGGES